MIPASLGFYLFTDKRKEKRLGFVDGLKRIIATPSNSNSVWEWARYSTYPDQWVWDT
jgi:hypothetical protein